MVSGAVDDLEPELLELPGGRAATDTAAEVVTIEDTFVGVFVAVGDTDDGLGVLQPLADAKQVPRCFAQAVDVQEPLLTKTVVLGASLQHRSSITKT